LVNLLLSLHDTSDILAQLLQLSPLLKCHAAAALPHLLLSLQRVDVATLWEKSFVIAFWLSWPELLTTHHEDLQLFLNNLSLETLRIRLVLQAELLVVALEIMFEFLYSVGLFLQLEIELRLAIRIFFKLVNNLTQVACLCLQPHEIILRRTFEYVILCYL